MHSVGTYAAQVPTVLTSTTNCSVVWKDTQTHWYHQDNQIGSTLIIWMSLYESSSMIYMMLIKFRARIAGMAGCQCGHFMPFSTVVDHRISYVLNLDNIFSAFVFVSIDTIDITAHRVDKVQIYLPYQIRSGSTLHGDTHKYIYIRIWQPDDQRKDQFVYVYIHIYA